MDKGEELLREICCEYGRADNFRSFHLNGYLQKYGGSNLEKIEKVQKVQ